MFRDWTSEEWSELLWSKSQNPPEENGLNDQSLLENCEYRPTSCTEREHFWRALQAPGGLEKVVLEQERWIMQISKEVVIQYTEVLRYDAKSKT